MTYQVHILRRAQRQMARLLRPEYEKIRDLLLTLGSDPRPNGCRKLTGREGWRLRVGPYRVIYEIDDAVRVITVLDVGHRRDIYR